MSLDGRQTLILAILVLFLGKYLNHWIRPLRAYNIPEPVTGGVLVSILFAVLYMVAGLEVQFDLGARDVLLVTFFTTVGLNAKFKMLLAGGKPLLILIGCAAAFLVVQNLVGVGVATVC
jgi:ESS family glutamate:Na+ symporter